MEPQPASEHRRAARSVAAVRAAVLTVSDTRTEATDTGGRCIHELLEEDGHRVVHREILRDEPPRIRERVEALCAAGSCDVVLTTGGTGIAPRDGTVEAVSPLLERPLPGFGELFRRLSFEEVGSAAMLSRAVAGVRGGVAVFCMPGSPPAVHLAMTKLILPELRHLVHQLRR